MKLQYLRIKQFRQFSKELVIDQFQDDINLFVGPNESGKSTIVQAIRAAFFERYKTSSLHHLCPWADSSAAPEVELKFTSQGKQWHLVKRFLKQPRCDLQVDGEHYSETEAEDYLAQWLGFDYAGRGASKADVQGIPGLLWVEQGSMQELNEPVDYAADQLQQALGQSFGEITTTGGDAVLQKVGAFRNELLTQTGKPRGEYKKALADYEQAEQHLGELEEEVRTYQQAVDTLGQLLDKQHRIVAAKPWEEQQTLAQSAQSELNAIEQIKKEQQQKKQTAEQLGQQCQLLRDRLEAIENQKEQLEERNKNKQQAEAAYQACQNRKPALEAAQDDAEKAYHKASQDFDSAQQQSKRQALQKDYDRLQQQLAEQQKQRQKAHQLHDAIQQLQRQIHASRLNTDDLESLKACVKEQQRLSIQREAIATRLHYDLASDKTIESDDDTLAGQGEKLLLTETQLDIPDVGRIVIQPGGKNTAELARQEQKCQQQIKMLCQQLGIKDLAEGEQQEAKLKADQQALKQQQAELSGTAPSGIESLDTQYQLNQTEQQQIQAQLEALPPAADSALAENTAKQALEQASQQLKAAEHALQHHKEALAEARVKQANAIKEWQTIQQEVTSERYQQQKTQSQNDLADAVAKHSQVLRQVEELAEKIQVSQPEQIAQDLERHQRSAEAMQQQAQQRAEQIIQLRSKLEVQGANGLEEKRDEQQQIRNQLQRRYEQLKRRADALAYLHTLLNDEQQQLTQQLQAPLQKHLNHYLKLLFEEASISINGALQPEHIQRHTQNKNEHGEVKDLSFGTREQLGLISRLAYADLLQEANKPTLLILDDALANSDTQRLAQLKRILFDAASRHQILLLSCRPEDWRDLGVVAHDIQALKVNAA